MRYLLSFLLIFGIAFAQKTTTIKKQIGDEKKIEVKKEIKDGKMLVTITEDGKTEKFEADLDDKEAIAKIDQKLKVYTDEDCSNLKVIKKVKEHDCDKENCDPSTCEHALKGECDKEEIIWRMKDKDDLKKMKIIKKGALPDDNILFDGKGGYLGVQIQDLTDQLGDHFKVKDGNGVLVSEVVKNSPAEKAGLKAGDIITKVDDKVVKNGGDLIKTVRGYEPESKVVVSVLRDGKNKQLKAMLGESENNFMYKFGDLKDVDEDHKMLLKMHPEKFEDFQFHSFPFDQDELKMEMEEMRKELNEMKEELKKLKEEK